VRHRIGPGNRAYSVLFSRWVRERRRSGGRHEVEYALSFAHRAGARPGPAQVEIRAVPAIEDDIRSWCASRALEPGRFVLLHPGSGGSCPAWPVEHWVHLAGQLASEGESVALSFGPQDAVAARAFDEAPEGVRQLPRLPEGLESLVAGARLAGAAVSNSTGPLHLAAALGTPTLGLYPPWRTCGVARWGPYASNGYAVVASEASPRRWSRRERRRHGAALMSGIPPALVASYTRALLRGQVLTCDLRSGG
jgi:ADP-heptose:LPS heptosyltransferase